MFWMSFSFKAIYSYQKAAPLMIMSVPVEESGTSPLVLGCLKSYYGHIRKETS